MRRARASPWHAPCDPRATFAQLCMQRQGAREMAKHSGGDEDERTIEVREERLTPRRERRQIGEIILRKKVEEAPARVEVEALRQEVDVERVPVGKEVDDRRAPWQEDGTLVVPVYEERLVVVKRLVLKEELRIRRRDVTRRLRLEDVVRREHVVVEDPQHTGVVHERFRGAERRDQDRAAG